jgi:hypothetical protein
MNNVVNNDPPADYIPIIKTLINAGARIEDGTLQRVEAQNSAPATLKRRLIELLTGG